MTLCCLTTSVSGGCDSEIVYEVCSDLSQSQGMHDSGTKAILQDKEVFS